MDRIKDLVRLAKLNKQLREKNYQQEWEKAGYQTTLAEFHKPITDKLKSNEEQLKTNYKAITDALEDISAYNYSSFEASTPRALMDVDPIRKRYTIDPDVDLDKEFLEKYDLPLPSELFNKPDEIEEIIKMTRKMSKRLGNLKGQITRGAEVGHTKQELNRDLELIRIYKEKIRGLNVTKLFKITGDGLISELEVLTNKLISGSKNKKLYNKIVNILDVLLKDGDLTSAEVKEYYDKFLYK